MHVQGSTFWSRTRKKRNLAKQFLTRRKQPFRWKTDSLMENAWPKRRPQVSTHIACVAWRFWLGVLSNKGGRGQRNREEIGAGATWKPNMLSTGCQNELKGAANPGRRFLFFSRLHRSCARLDKTAMLRRLPHTQKLNTNVRLSRLFAPRVGQARNMNIGERRHCCVTFWI